MSLFKAGSKVRKLHGESTEQVKKSLYLESKVL